MKSVQRWGATLSICAVVSLFVSCQSSSTPTVKKSPTHPPTSTPAPRRVVATAEMRGVWLSDPRGQDWERVMRDLRESGFNAIFVNFATAGAAFYPSKIVPQVSHRDEMRLCLEAARRHGIAVHAKLICFFTYWSPQEFQKKLIREKRELREPNGKPHLQSDCIWLDASLEVNRAHVAAIAREILQRYDVDGLQMDYIRFPEIHGVARTSQSVFIDDAVTRIRAELRRAQPTKPLSASVFYHLGRARNDMGQDWTTWGRRGLVDFLCPMNYTTDNGRFVEWTRAQLRELGGSASLHAGIGGYMFKDGDALASQIALARQLTPSGFVVFAYNDDFRNKMLPRLRYADRRP